MEELTKKLGLQSCGSYLESNTRVSQVKIEELGDCFIRKETQWKRRGDFHKICVQWVCSL